MTDKEMGEDSMRPLEVFNSNHKIPQNNYDEDPKNAKDSATEDGRTKRKSALIKAETTNGKPYGIVIVKSQPK